ncbi:MAG: cobalamin B12-binding domain-containing protein [Alphaproteobacteria bacterium]|nr:cobalamin B12-binding domain-containing protein [Alphaproteobacteria bacterium]
MRVLLVQAFTALDMELVYPIGLAYLAAHLDGHEVEIFDLNLHRDDPYTPFGQALDRFKPDVVGISLRNMKVAMPGVHTDDFQPQAEAIEFVKQRVPGIKVVAGGTAFSLYSEAMMTRLPAIDMGCWGESEESFPELLEKLDRPWDVQGVWYRDPQSREIKFTGYREKLDFKSLRHPRRDLVDHAPYLASSFVSVGVQSKRGCALRCIHCSDTYLLGHQVRMRSAKDVVDEMQELVEDHGVQQMFFCDQIFNIPVKHSIEICQEIVDRRLEVAWSAWFNEHRNTLPDELMVWLKRAGCGLLSFSPDHVDDRMLKNLDKNFRYEDMLYTVDIAKKHGMDVEYSFFLNSPGEDVRSLMAIFKFLLHAKIQLRGQLRMFTLLMMNPIRIYPHTRLAELARESGMIPEDHDLIEAAYWNPGGIQHLVTGWQHTAKSLYDVRRRWKEATGNTYASVTR